MSVIKETIVVEDKFREIFSYLPNMAGEDAEEYPVIFKGGDQKELIAFIKAQTGGDSPYPLIWLIYPFIEVHSRTKVTLENISFVMAVETNQEMSVEERLEETYKKILLPLFDNMKDLFRRANIFNTDEVYSVIKYPNYSGDEDDGEERTKVTDIWDAIKITFSCSIIDACLNKKNLNLKL